MNHFVHRLSRIFQPVTPQTKHITKIGRDLSISQKSLVANGYIFGCSNGMFALLPMGQRVLQKLIAMIDDEMQNIVGQRISLPMLTRGSLLRKTGRWELFGHDLMKLNDRHDKEYALSPTHEESITQMLSQLPPISHRQLPLRLYQITSKFRDEKRPRFGLLRSREFLMKDLYTFDASHPLSQVTYEEVSNAYNKIFMRLKTPFVRVVGDCGEMGGELSHEFHLLSQLGEDQLWLCTICQSGVSSQMVQGTEGAAPLCATCGTPMKSVAGIEVGHTFLLGNKYSDIFNLKCHNVEGHLQMGCYGIGISRLMAAVLEAAVESKDDNAELKDDLNWPFAVAPYSICIITPKLNSKEESARPFVQLIYSQLNDVYMNDVVIDDRDSLTIGKRILDAKRNGFPVTVVVGKKSCDVSPKFDVIVGDNLHLVTKEDLVTFIGNIFK